MSFYNKVDCLALRQAFAIGKSVCGCGFVIVLLVLSIGCDENRPPERLDSDITIEEIGIENEDVGEIVPPTR